MNVQRSSKQYVRIPVSATLLGQPNTSFTSDTVSIALVTADHPGSGDFVSAAWETDAYGVIAAVLNVDFAALVSALSISTFPATVNAFVKITDSPEVPVLAAGTIAIT